MNKVKYVKIDFIQCMTPRLDKLYEKLISLMANIDSLIFRNYIQVMHPALLEYLQQNELSEKIPNCFNNFYYLFDRICKLCEIENCITNSNQYYYDKGSIKIIIYELRYMSTQLLNCQAPWYVRIFSNNYIKVYNSDRRPFRKNYLQDPTN